LARQFHFKKSARYGKTKGQNYTKEVRQKILDTVFQDYPKELHEDFRCTPGGVNGPDFMLSTVIKKKFPFAVECKKTETLTLKSAWIQALSHVLSERNYLFPLIIFSKKNTPSRVILEWNPYKTMGVSSLQKVYNEDRKAFDKFEAPTPTVFNYKGFILCLDSLDNFLDIVKDKTPEYWETFQEDYQNKVYIKRREKLYLELTSGDVIDSLETTETPFFLRKG